jgi:hypothetical protein
MEIGLSGGFCGLFLVDFWLILWLWCVSDGILDGMVDSC